MSPSDTPRDAHAARLARLLGFLERDPSNDTLRVDIFDTALAAGDFAQASQQAAWALQRDPDDIAWRHRLALMNMGTGDWVGARALLAGLAEARPDDAAIAYNLAYADFAQGEFARAEQRLVPLVHAGAPGQPALWLLLSCQHRRGAPDEAVATFRQAGEGGASGAAFGAASLAALDADEPAAAAAWAERALALDDGQAEARVAKSSLLLGVGDPAASLGLLAPVLERRPDDGRALATAAMAFMRGGRLDDAHALFERSLRAMPGHIGTWIAAGWCEVFRGNLAAARAAFERAIALDPNFGESHGALAVVDAREGRVEAAQAGIRRAMGLDRRGLSAEFAQAVLAGETADPQRFLARAQAALGRHVTPDGRSMADAVMSPPRRA